MVVEEYYFISVKAVFLNTYIISHTYAYIRYGSRPTTLPVVRCKTTTCQRSITYCLRTSANNAASAELLDEGTGQLSSLPALFFCIAHTNNTILMYLDAPRYYWLRPFWRSIIITIIAINANTHTHIHHRL